MPAPEPRPILTGDEYAGLSIMGQIVLATSTLVAHASVIRREMDLDALRVSASRVMQQTDRATSADGMLARRRAFDGLKVAAAAIAFVEACTARQSPESEKENSTT